MSGVENERGSAAAGMVYTVRPEETGRRVRDIHRRSMSVSYSAMKSAKWDGRILVNGERAQTDRRVEAGDRVSIRWQKDEPVYALKPFEMPLKVAYLDEHLMAVDKPAPLASQSSRGHPDDSLENAVYAWFGCPADFVYRPVNRLDRGTSGLMIIARTPHAQHLLQQELHTPAFRRRYLALTEGVPAERTGVLDFPIAKAPGATVKRMVTPEGRPSVTRYEVIAAREGRALMRLELETGRTHQIRVHLSHIGCPVVGDFLYGREDPAFPGRFALHSAEIELTHPVTGEIIRLQSEPDWIEIMETQKSKG